MLDLLPDWLKTGIGEDAAFWIGYFTNGKHLAWYASLQFTVFAACYQQMEAVAAEVDGGVSLGSLGINHGQAFRPACDIDCCSCWREYAMPALLHW